MHSQYLHLEFLPPWSLLVWQLLHPPLENPHHKSKITLLCILETTYRFHGVRTYHVLIRLQKSDPAEGWFLDLSPNFIVILESKISVNCNYLILNITPPTAAVAYIRNLKWIYLRQNSITSKNFFILCENILDRSHKSRLAQMIPQFCRHLRKLSFCKLQMPSPQHYSITPQGFLMTAVWNWNMDRVLIKFKAYKFSNSPKGRDPGMACDSKRSFTSFLYKIIESWPNAYLPIQHHTAKSASSVWHGQWPRHQGASFWARRRHSPLSSQALPPWAKHPTDL